MKRFGDSICDGIYNPNFDYVYIPKRRLGGSQYLMRQFAEQVKSYIPTIPVRCQDIAIRILCTHFYLPCGTNGTIHVPLPICSDICRYMSETLCPDIWQFTANYLVSDQIGGQYINYEGRKLPSCNSTDRMIDYLNLTSDCCSSGGVVLPQTSVASTAGKQTLYAWHDFSNTEYTVSGLCTINNQHLFT